MADECTSMPETAHLQTPTSPVTPSNGTSLGGRVRKATQKFTFVEAKGDEAEDFAAPVGKGVQVRDMEFVRSNVEALGRQQQDMIKQLYSIMYGRRFQQKNVKLIKEHLLDFSGIIEQDEKSRELLVAKMGRWKRVFVHEVMDLLAVDRSKKSFDEEGKQHDKEALIDRLIDWLYNPQETKLGEKKATIAAKKAKQKANKRAKKEAKKTSGPAKKKQRTTKKKAAVSEEETEEHEETESEGEESSSDFEEAKKPSKKRKASRRPKKAAIVESDSEDEEDEKASESTVDKVVENTKQDEPAGDKDEDMPASDKEKDKEQPSVDKLDEQPAAELEAEAVVADKEAAVADKEQAKPEPLGDEVCKKVREIIAQGNAEELTVKKIVRQLSVDLGRDMSTQKKAIKEFITNGQTEL